MRHPAVPLLAFAAGALVACSAPTTTTPPDDDGTVAAVEITPASTVSFASLGLTTKLTGTARNAGGTALTAKTLSWSTKHGGVVSVSSSGLVTAIGNGVDTVVAAVDGQFAQREVRVEQVAAAVTISNGNQVLGVLGGNVTLSAHVKDANNRDVAGADIAWTSSNAQALPVDDAGKVTATGVGTATITATSGSMQASVNVSVQLSGPIGPAVIGAEVACSGGFAGPFPCNNVSLVSYLPLGGLGISAGSIELNDNWGWTDASTGKEYALVGRYDGLAFVDLSVPTNPRYLGYLPKTSAAATNFWRDVKVYHDYAFVVSDGAGPHGMQVFDLHQLRNVTAPKVFAPATTYTGVASVHNIFINEATGFAYLVGSNSGGTTCGGGLHMVNIQNPTAPTFAGCFADTMTGRSRTGYTHDVQCVVYNGPDASYTGHEICLGSNETALSIADVTNKAAPVAVSHASYPGVAYTHQGWLSTNQRYFFVNDELDEGNGSSGGGTRTLVWDVSDLDDPLLVAQYHGPTNATDHNNYVVGSRLYASNYQFGIRVLDITNPTAPTQAGYFDTAPELPNVPGYGGSWSNYPFFASGIIVVTSSAEGLFVLRAH